MNGEKIIDLMWEVKEGKKHPNKAYKELCILFGVVGQSEQLPDTCQDYAIGKTGCIMNGNCKECS